MLKKCIIVPDSFKGTMSSRRVCDIMEKAVHACYPGAEVISIPVADGGEGSVDCFLAALGGKHIVVDVAGPYMETMPVEYGLLRDGATAVIEMASCAGLPLVENRKNPCLATTYGVGQQLLDAAQHGAKKIILGLGGSATNDGGCGAAAAAGVQFYDSAGNVFVPTGGTLKDICSIDASGFATSLGAVEIVAMCDIDNPMHGTNGAAYIFGPQKGADMDTVLALDDGLQHLSNIIHRDLGIQVANIPGAGAAGAMGAGMAAFFGARLCRGIETVLDAVDFDRLLRSTTVVFTGEGRIDRQSLNGKVVVGVARRAKKAGVPVVAVVGDIEDGIDKVYAVGVSAVFSINRRAVDFSHARRSSEIDLRLTMENLMRLWRTIEKPMGNDGKSAGCTDS